MEDERTYTVYCHTNKTNGKKYVGITKQTLNQRWRQGKGYGKTAPIYKAIKHYGWDGFDHDVLEDGLTYEEACEAEKRYIRELNCLVPNGYNLEYGGNANKGCNEITRKKMSEMRKGVKQNISEEERKRRSEFMKKICPMHDPVLKKKCMERRKQAGYKVSEEMKAVLSKKAKERLNTPEWQERLRIQNTGERNPMYGKHCSEYQKKKLREAHLGKKHSEEAKRKMSLNHADFSGANNYNAKAVRQYTWDCEFVAEYDCVVNASKVVPHCDIYSCLNGKTKQAGGYLWRYAQDEPPTEPYKKRERHPKKYIKKTDILDERISWRKCRKATTARQPMKVGQYDLDGNLISIFSSTREAGRMLNINPSSISACCVGDYRTSKGFVFQYIDEEEYKNEEADSESNGGED